MHLAPPPALVRHLVARAMRPARDRRTVTCLVFPNDVQDLEAVEQPPRKHGTVHSGIGYTAIAGAPSAGERRCHGGTAPAKASSEKPVTLRLSS